MGFRRTTISDIRKNLSPVGMEDIENFYKKSDAPVKLYRPKYGRRDSEMYFSRNSNLFSIVRCENDEDPKHEAYDLLWKFDGNIKRVENLFERDISRIDSAEAPSNFEIYYTLRSKGLVTDYRKKIGYAYIHSFSLGESDFLYDSDTILRQMDFSNAIF
jgi:hypothetical protein